MHKLFTLLFLSCLFWAAQCLQAQHSSYVGKGGFKAINDTMRISNWEKPQTCNVLINDEYDQRNAPKGIKITKMPKGTAEVETGRGRPKIVYTANYEGDGPDELTYQICSPQKQCSEAKVIIYKCPSHDLGYPKPIDTLVQVNSSISFAFPGQVINVSRSKKPEHGAFTLHNNNSELRYNPEKDFMGIDRLVFGVYEDHPTCGRVHINSYSYTLPIVPSNENNKAPVAVDDEITVRGSAKTKIDVWANDYDPENSLYPKFKAVSKPEHGRIKRTPRTITYTAKSKFKGQDRFTYTICDYNGACSTAVVLVTVK